MLNTRCANKKPSPSLPPPPPPPPTSRKFVIIITLRCYISFHLGRCNNPRTGPAHLSEQFSNQTTDDPASDNNNNNSSSSNNNNSKLVCLDTPSFVKAIHI
ncbi:hypothetical protein M0804_006161 [Polistes exclamans]|nr:hypothetical protein M0804_006161 [Polistes exclamans]